MATNAAPPWLPPRPDPPDLATFLSPSSDGVDLDAINAYLDAKLAWDEEYGSVRLDAVQAMLKLTAEDPARIHHDKADKEDTSDFEAHPQDDNLPEDANAPTPSSAPTMPPDSASDGPQLFAPTIRSRRTLTVLLSASVAAPLAPTSAGAVFNPRLLTSHDNFLFPAVRPPADPARRVTCQLRPSAADRSAPPGTAVLSFRGPPDLVTDPPVHDSPRSLLDPVCCLAGCQIDRLLADNPLGLSMRVSNLADRVPPDPAFFCNLSDSSARMVPGFSPPVSTLSDRAPPDPDSILFHAETSLRTPPKLSAVENCLMPLLPLPAVAASIFLPPGTSVLWFRAPPDPSLIAE